ncbi:MAG: bacteriohemerythrin [Candidatus Hydrothermales bacterium]
MGFIKWDEKFSTGVEQIDDQHKKFVEIINELHNAMKQGKGKEIVKKILNELKSYSVYHFKTEETYMTKYKYQEYQEHKNDHEFFKTKVKELLDKDEKGYLGLSIETLNFMKNWLIKHILTTDKKLANILLQKSDQ